MIFNLIIYYLSSEGKQTTKKKILCISANQLKKFKIRYY